MNLLKQKKWFDSPEFKADFHCDTPLGSFCSANGTTFCLWAPTAESVVLSLYERGSGGAAVRTIPMQPVPNGLWVFETKDNLDGIYYDFEVTVDGIARATADP